MANFNCSICGGQIAMQANRGGICKECGMEYDIDAIRAMLGANNTSPTATSVTAPAPTVRPTDEIDREALLVYLNDVRVLETIISKSKSESDALQLKVSEKKQSYEKEIKTSEPRLFPEPKQQSLFSACLFFGIMLLGITLVLFVDSESTRSDQDVFFWLIAASVLCIIGVKSILNKKKEYNRMLAAYRGRKRQYDTEIQEYKTRCQIMQHEIQALTTECNEMNDSLHNDVTQATQLLEQAYAANIIPLHFRNIHGVYYLYDYLSTSNQTLSEALIQCNLDTIKEKLDSVIRVQSDQVVQQAITNAKLGQIYQVAEATMNNTAIAAKYAQIASGNTMLMQWLVNKQLACQTSTF